MNGWPDNQQKMLEDWWKLWTAPLSHMQANATTAPPVDSWFADVLAQWGTYVQQMNTAFTPAFSADLMSQFTETTRLSLEQFLASQQQSVHLMGMAVQAWQAIMSGAASPDEWPKTLNAYVEQMRQQLHASMDTHQAMQNQAELWQQYSEAMQKLGQPWLDFWLQMQPQAAAATDPRQAAAASAVEFTKLSWDTFNQTAGRLLGAPTMGLTREFTEKLNQGFLLWQAHQQASLAYQLLIGNTWVDAFAAYMQKLLALAQAGETIDQQAKLLDLWIEVADEQFIQVFHSDQFAQVQSTYINSSMALRRQQRTLSEVWLRMHDLPTRSDLDAAHQAIFELRQEVKAMKKALRDRATVTPPPTAKPAEKPTAKRKTASTRKARIQQDVMGKGSEE